MRAAIRSGSDSRAAPRRLIDEETRRARLPSGQRPSSRRSPASFGFGHPSRRPIGLAGAIVVPGSSASPDRRRRVVLRPSATVAGLIEPPTEVLVRAARTEDVNAVLEPWAQARSQAAATPDIDDAVVAPIEHPGSVLLVAEHDDHIAGSLIVAWDGWRGNMYRLAVLPHLRRQGIARRLVDAGHEYLRRNDARRVTALVGHEEEDAVGLWNAMGYRHDTQLARFVRNL